MAHHRDSRFQNTANGHFYLLTTFHLHGMGTAFLHDSYGGAQSLLGITLITAKRNIDHNEGPFGGPHHRGGMIDHLVEGDGQCGFVACHDITGGIPHQNGIHMGAIHNFCHGIIVGGKHADFFTTLFHIHQRFYRNPFIFFFSC